MKSRVPEIERNSIAARDTPHTHPTLIPLDHLKDHRFSSDLSGVSRFFWGLMVTFGTFFSPQSKTGGFGGRNHRLISRLANRFNQADQDASGLSFIPNPRQRASTFTAPACGYCILLFIGGSTNDPGFDRYQLPDAAC